MVRGKRVRRAAGRTFEISADILVMFQFFGTAIR